MYIRFFILGLLVLNFFSCEKDDAQLSLTPYEEGLIGYFKEIALGTEDGNATEITRKWRDDMRIFIDGDPAPFLLDKVQQALDQINELATDGFSASIVANEASSNSYLYFGKEADFIAKFPEVAGTIFPNIARFDVRWNKNIIYQARIFINTETTDRVQQESLVLEEITQTLGLMKDSPRFTKSIFYETPSDGGFATDYLRIDKDLIRLLYHPEMRAGLNATQLDQGLRIILQSEK